MYRFIQLKRESVNDPAILWDATKGFIRKNVILFFSNLKKDRLHKLQQLESKYAELDHTLQNNYSDSIAMQKK